MNPLCPICRTTLVRDVAARLISTTLLTGLGWAYGPVGRLVAGAVGYWLGAQIEGWLCKPCGRRFDAKLRPALD